jgi:glyoxylase-like metal-dependent hydrolase (beta-lactamase superfamily II)
MEVELINTGYFKLDGGAMFGVVPKSLWQRTNPADEKNLCSWALRSLLVKDGDRAILIDNGIGNKQSEHFFRHYYLHGDDSLAKGLADAGMDHTDITDMMLTHLHFDHCGGGIKQEGEHLLPTFSNATYWSNTDHWQWATQPNPREKASFLSENILPMQESGQLKFVALENQHDLPFEIIFANGHTDKQMLPKIEYKGHTLVFAADLIPSVGHIPLAFVMGYDTRPLITMDEKAKFLKEAADNNYVLIFQHDSVNECCTVQRTEKGVGVDQIFPFSEL